MNKLFVIIVILFVGCSTSVRDVDVLNCKLGCWVDDYEKCYGDADNKVCLIGDNQFEEICNRRLFESVHGCVKRDIIYLRVVKWENDVYFPEYPEMLEVVR